VEANRGSINIRVIGRRFIVRGNWMEEVAIQQLFYLNFSGQF
jgi:hypothetical protein